MLQLNANVDGSCSLPVKKGDRVSLWWSGSTISAFRFIYAAGSESEAS